MRIHRILSRLCLLIAMLLVAIQWFSYSHCLHFQNNSISSYEWGGARIIEVWHGKIVYATELFKDQFVITSLIGPPSTELTLWHNGYYSEPPFTKELWHIGIYYDHSGQIRTTGISLLYPIDACALLAVLFGFLARLRTKPNRHGFPIEPNEKDRPTVPTLPIPPET